ncbi:MAG: ribonuclease E/G [Pseudomonadota bacterium]
MTGRVILIDRLPGGQQAAALMVDGRLEDLLIDPPQGDATPVPGEIYRARVDRLVPKQGAAFVRMGEAMGYLREAKGRREGDRLLVQVTGYAEPDKAVPVTARPLYKGRYAIHTPHAPGINLSRQIKDAEERARLLAVAEQALADQGADPETGLILRSAAAQSAPTALSAEVKALLADRDRVEVAEGDGPVYTATARQEALREWDAVPSEAAASFETQGVWDEIDRLRSPRAALRSGGWLSVEATAALVAVDVNTGGGFQSGDALTANLEAAREIPRQLRLRGLGGIVVIDWAPLPKRDRKRIQDTLKTALRRDPVETTIAGWTPLGLLELTRKRERRPLAQLLD